ncbi:hypothetical protein OF83DRAFT_1175518 [Amylostereum chailletii]|nr:hypothetical protein OF83DRAFT_1175518 [Amylostereum chailletii]
MSARDNSTNSKTPRPTAYIRPWTSHDFPELLELSPTATPQASKQALANMIAAALSKPTLIALALLLVLLTLLVLASIMFIVVRSIHRRRTFASGTSAAHPVQATLLPFAANAQRPSVMTSQGLAYPVCPEKDAIKATPPGTAHLDASFPAVDSPSDSDSDSVDMPPTPAIAFTLPSSNTIHTILPKQDCTLLNVDVAEINDEEDEASDASDAFDLAPILNVAAFAQCKRGARGGLVGLGIVMGREEV